MLLHTLMLLVTNKDISNEIERCLSVNWQLRLQ